MNENSFDENNLLYVRKTYEVEVTEKARRIFADNIVQTTLDETNKKLDELIAEMNAKLGFVTQKMVGANGVEEYIKDVHNQIDTTVVDTTQLVDSGIVESGSHPSVTTFKNNRSETKYKNYDFINKNLRIGFKEPALRFYNNTDINEDDKIHTFNIHMDDIERLKIVEFSFTYSQCPNIVKILEGEVYKEPTTRINRVFSGRFFIIRHDPINAPDEIIVKAIVENADNTGNIVDEFSVDVKKSNIENKIVLKNELGPTFDIYFRISSRSNLMICIGNINPYKYMLQKNYVETNKEIVDNFNLVKSGFTAANISDVFYSENIQKAFIVDKVNEKIYMISAIDKFSIDNIAMDESTIYDKLTTDGFFVKDIGSYTFVGDKTNHCFVYTKGNINDYTDLGVMVEDVQMMSTNEIIVQVGSELNRRKISRLYMFNYSTTNLNTNIFGEFHVSTTDINFIQQNKFMEYEPGKIILVSNSKEGTVYYKFLRFNNSTNTYTNGAAESATIEQKIELPELENLDPKNDGTSLNIIKSETGLFIHLNYDSETNGKKTVIVSVRDLKINISTYVFETVEILKKYNRNNRLAYELTDFIKKIVSTSLFTFGITEDNKLLIIDDKYVIEALNFTSVEENGVVKGYSDKNSVLYMKPVSGEKEYYLIDKPYLQDVKNIYQSYKGNIYILDGKGVYELTTSKNLICRFWTDESVFSDIVVNRESDAYIVSSKDGKQNIFCHDFKYDESSTKKLRHKYYDLVNGDYKRYDSSEDYTGYTTKDDEVMIDFDATLYCTLIDKMSSMYNSKDINNMYYSDNYTFKDINPVKEHYVIIDVNGENINKNVPITKFSLSTNKYGFINYHGFTLLNTTNLSNINDDNLYVLVHKTGDNLSIADYREVIYRLIKEQTIRENDKYDSEGNLKPGYETTLSVTKTYKSLNNNKLFRLDRAISVADNFNRAKLFGSLLSDGYSYIYKDTIYNFSQTKTKFGSGLSSASDDRFVVGKLPVTFLNSYDNDPLKYGKQINPFNVIYNKINYFIGYVIEDDVQKLAIVKEEVYKNNDESNHVALTLVKTISNVIAARPINDQLYYSKNTGGLFYIDDEMNEQEKVSSELGYIFYDFTEINNEIYGITDKAVLVKINKDNPKDFPEIIVHDQTVLNGVEGKVLADIFNFNSSDKLIIRIAHENDNLSDLYTPYIYIISKENLNEYMVIQKPYEYKVETSNGLTNFINMAPDFIYNFVEVHGSIIAHGSNIFQFNSKELSFEAMDKLGRYLVYPNISDGKISRYSGANDISYQGQRTMIKTPYGTCMFVPSNTSVLNYNTVDIELLVDDVNEEFIYTDADHDSMDTNPSNNCIMGYMSNNKSSGKKYKIEVYKGGEVRINDKIVSKIDTTGKEQWLASSQVNHNYPLEVKDIIASIYKSSVKIVKDVVSGTYNTVDPISNEPINLFKLDHKRCAWNSLSFDTTVTVGSLIEKHVIPYKYVVDDASQFVKVDTSVVKYPIPGISYFTKTTVGSHDVYEATSPNITRWEVTSSGNTEYYEQKHHYEMMTNVAEVIPVDTYVFICENKYYSKAEINISDEGLISLPTTEEYYTLTSKIVPVLFDKIVDERGVIILNDDKILLHAKVYDSSDTENGSYSYKTIIYDSYKENDFTRHDIWDSVYPKTGFNIRRIWETSKGKFAVIKLPCYENSFLALISDDLQSIQCKLKYDIIDPGCAHLIDTGKEILISLATQNYDGVVCYKYDSNLNVFTKTNDSLIYIDSVLVDGKTYIAGIKNTISTGGELNNILGLYILDEDKNLLVSMNNGMCVPLYCTNRNSMKQFDNVFVKRTNSVTRKEEAYVFFGLNSVINSSNDDSLYDCIHISGNKAQLEDLNFLAYTKLRNGVGINTFTNVILTPDNEILLLTTYSSIIALNEEGKINVLKGPTLITNFDDEFGDIVFIGSYLSNGNAANIIESTSMDDSGRTPYPFNWYYYNPVCNTYLIDEPKEDEKECKISISGGYNGRTNIGTYNGFIEYNYYLNNLFNKSYIKHGDPSDIYETLFRYRYKNNDYSLEILPYKDTTDECKYPVSLINQKILPVKYKETMVFGTSIMDEQTGEPSTNYFALYDYDKNTVISDYMCFDYLFATKSGKMFGVFENNIYENDDVLSSTKWFRVQGGSAHESEHAAEGFVYNSFRKMIENNYGIFYFDSKNILKYNENEDKFETVPHTFDLTNNTLNFAENFDTGLFIGNKRDVEFEDVREHFGYTESDFSSPGINFNYYDPKQKAFISLLPDTILTSVSKMDISRIVDIKETSRGVFILYCANDKTYKNTIFRCYLSVYNVLLWEECKYKQTFTMLDGTKYENEYPCNHKQIWEDKQSNTIWISGTSYGFNMTMDKYTNTEITVGRYSGAWAYRKFIENDDGDYRHNHGNDYRFEPNVSDVSLDDGNDETDSIIYSRKLTNPLFKIYLGMENVIETNKFGTFLGKSIVKDNIPTNLSDSNFYKIDSDGLNEDVESISYFDFLSYKDNPNRIDVYSHCKIKEINNKLFIILYNFNFGSGKKNFIILEYKVDENGKVVLEPIHYCLENYILYQQESNTYQIGKYYKYGGIDIEEYNGIVYVKDSYDHNIYIIGKNEFEGIVSSPELESDNVLYELRAVVDNQASYNNLVEKTDNSNLDKFVFKEIGVINGITGECRHIFQYFEPNEYYNESDGVVKPLIEKPREFHQSNSIKELYKNIYQKFKNKNLINNRYIKEGQSIIADGFKHEVTQILGDVEKYLVNTDNVRIELKIYPVEAEDYIETTVIPCKFGITTSISDDESGVEPFDPYD